jgi:hypothetical protein
MTTTYRISSSSDATLNRIDGETYETFAAALAAVRRLAPDSVRWVRAECGTYVYACDDDMDADQDGRAPHLAIALIETVR